MISNREEENHGFVEQIKTSILDDKANKPKGIIKATMALLLIAIFVVSAFFLSIGKLTAGSAIALIASFLHLVPVEANNLLAEHCHGLA